MRLTLFCIITFFTQTILAQKYDNRIAPTNLPFSSIEQIMLPLQDNKALLEVELERRGPGIAPRFATSIGVDLNAREHGGWEMLGNGMAVWRLGLSSVDAHSLNLGFSQYYMPAGGSLILYSPDKKHVMGPFTPADNEEHEQLWTPVFDGESLVIEVQLPQGKKDELELQLDYVNHDFLGFSSVSSGSCNLDVICAAADGWELIEEYRDIIQSVAMFSVGGVNTCTGFLINNTRNDCAPYFMTAKHCLDADEAPSLVAYWNFNNSICRQPDTPESGSNGDGQLTDFNTGSVFRAAHGVSDFMLVRLDDPVSETADAFFAGWSNLDYAPKDTVIGIHHPRTDEKRISFEFDSTFVSFHMQDTPDLSGNHISVPDWDVGTTEGGSSGSPLFDKQKRVVGQLHGGFAACGNDRSDFYGWFHTSWEGGGTPQTRLKDWLDPDNTGLLTLDGRSQRQCSFYVIASQPQQAICAPDSAVFQIQVSENFSGDVLLSLDSLPDGISATFESNPVSPGDTVLLTFSNTNAIPGGEYIITVSGTDGLAESASDITLMIFEGIPGVVLPQYPINGAEGLSTQLNLGWQALVGVESYDVQLATDAGFTNIIAEGNSLSTASFPTGALESMNVYYWRVRGSNICGSGEWSPVFNFFTAAINCSATNAGDSPIEISPEIENTITSTLEVHFPGTVMELSIGQLDITHSYVGDLEAVLTSPSGTSATLFRRPGTENTFLGCGGENLVLSFDDNASNTANDLENTCNDLPAIEGAFQAIDPFTSFIGELASGTWTLTVIDHLAEDGGALVNWTLNICYAIPDEAVILPLLEEIALCESESLDFELVVGTGFEGQEVSLSAVNLPNGAVLDFSSNPTAPGSSVIVTVSGLVAGNSELELAASDGVQSAQTMIPLNITSAPINFSQTSPLDGASNINLSPTLSWEASAGAAYYELILSTTPDYSNILIQETLSENYFDVADLEMGTTYYWKVFANNDCGVTEAEGMYRFSTIQSLDFNLSPQELEVCQSGEAVFNFEVPDGFNDSCSLTTLFSDIPEVLVNYNVNPDSLAPGTSVEVIISGLFHLGPGTYSSTFVISDGMHESSEAATITISAAPEVPTLVFPLNGADSLEQMPFLAWRNVAEASYYMVEIAADDSFTDLIETANVNQDTFYQISEALAESLFYWRVTAVNDCGAATAAAYYFTVTSDQLLKLGGSEISILPNPTNNLINVHFSKPLAGDLLVEVFSLNGQQMQQGYFKYFPGILQIDLSAYASGLYLLRLSNEKESRTWKIVLE